LWNGRKGLTSELGEEKGERERKRERERERERQKILLTLSDVGVLVTIAKLKSLVDTGGGTRGDIGAENT